MEGTVNLRPRKSKTQQTNVDCNTNGDGAKRKPKTAAEKQREYNERMRSLHPEKYAKVLGLQKKRSAVNRIEMALLPDDDEKKQRAKMLNRKRAEKYRNKKKALEKDAETSGVSKPKVKPVTRAEKEKELARKEKDKMRKRKERESWSWQKKKAENEKSKKRRLNKKLENLEENSKATGTNSNEENDHEDRLIRSQASRRQAVYAVRKALPKSPRKKRQTLGDILNGEKIPRTNFADKLVKEMMRNKKMKKSVMMTVMRSASKDVFLKYLGLSKQLKNYHVKKAEAPKKTEKINKRMKVEQFLLMNSQLLGGKKAFYRGTPKRLLHRNLTDLHKAFTEEEMPVSFSFFCKVKRCMKYCTSAAKQAFNQTLCEVCENTKLKIKALCNSTTFPTKDIYQYVDIFSCPKQDGKYHDKECVNGTCANCPKHSLTDEDKKKMIIYNEWGLKEVHPGKKRKCLTTMTKAAEEVSSFLMENLLQFRKHLFTARWQYSQFLEKKQHLQEGEFLMVMDFAENYRCCQQDEVQSAYWSYEQATIHPIVTYFNCPTCPGMTVTDSVVMISDDMQHDSHAVDLFFNAAVEHLTRQGLQLKRIVQFTDGCGVQYKSKLPFAKIATKNGCYSLERHYFGTGHGKNPSDGESAVIKTKASRSVKFRQLVIQNALDLYKFCKEALTKDSTINGECSHSRRAFYYIPSASIVRESPIQAKTLKGTRKVQCVRSTGDGIGVETRNLSCWCTGCEGDGHCTKPYPQDWSYQRIISNSEMNVSALSDILSTSMVQQVEDDIGHNVQHLAQEVSSCNLVASNAVIDNPGTDNPDIDNPDTDAPSSNYLDTNNQIDLQPGSWVVATFSGKTLKNFLGMILQVDNGEALVKFCRQSGNHFTWPHAEDVSWVDHDSLIKVQPPSLDSRERIYLTSKDMTYI